jgi:hypothetical protein
MPPEALIKKKDEKEFNNYIIEEEPLNIYNMNETIYEKPSIQ